VSLPNTRYRFEGARACIDIRLKTLQQLFDGRDPAPFRERDLDEDAVEYIVGAAEELGAGTALKLVIHVPTRGDAAGDAELEDAIIGAAIRAHFDYELDRLRHRMRAHVRQGQMALGVGLIALVACLTLAELTTVISLLHVRQILREGLVIVGWVAMWKPVELLLYDWWPLSRKRGVLSRIRAAEVEIVKW
jgi:hypothetical protein